MFWEILVGLAIGAVCATGLFFACGALDAWARDRSKARDEE